MSQSAPKFVEVEPLIRVFEGEHDTGWRATANMAGPLFLLGGEIDRDEQGLLLRMPEIP